jgi:formate-dependent nitrite reductase membrane component NrfD
MQACPYDALYIDPETMTSAKCNFCANRVEQNLQPACVVVCPEQAIIAGDLDNPHSNISKIISQNSVVVRKPEKGTNPKLFYIDGDNKVLLPSQTNRKENYMWSSQDKGVGHYAGKDFSNKPMYTEDVQPKTNRAYDVPKKGRLWGYEFPAYMVTKSASTGIVMILTLLLLMGNSFSKEFLQVSYIISLVFLALTGLFLILDLDQPFRFHYIMLRPQWGSWLVRGAYLILIFGTLTGILFLQSYLGIAFNEFTIYFLGFTFVIACLTSVYTAFLLAQAKGRDFWQSPLLPFEKLALSFALGSATLLISHHLLFPVEASVYASISLVFVLSTLMILLISLMEVFITHSTSDAQTVAHSFKYGSWKIDYWGGLLLGTIIPLLYLVVTDLSLQLGALLSLFIGVYILMRAWIYAPQDISLI